MKNPPLDQRLGTRIQKNFGIRCCISAHLLIKRWGTTASKYQAACHKGRGWKNATVDQMPDTSIALLEKSHLWIKGWAPRYLRKCWDQLIRRGIRAPKYQAACHKGRWWKNTTSRSNARRADSSTWKSHLWIKGWAPGYKSVGMSSGAHAVDEGLVPHPLMDHHACSIKPSPLFKLT